MLPMNSVLRIRWYLVYELQRYTFYDSTPDICEMKQTFYSPWPHLMNTSNISIVFYLYTFNYHLTLFCYNHLRTNHHFLSTYYSERGITGGCQGRNVPCYFYISQFSAWPNIKIWHHYTGKCLSWWWGNYYTLHLYCNRQHYTSCWSKNYFGWYRGQFF